MRYRLWIAAGVLAGVALGTQAYGQKGGTAGAATSTGTNPEAASGVGKYSNYDNMAEHQHGSMHFTGKVKVEDATFPWDPIRVVVTCNGVARYVTEADAKGNFVIQDSRTASEVVPTKSNPQQASASQLIGCDAEASVPGFQSSKLHIANVNIMDNPFIGTIVLRPATGAGAASAGTSASKDAMKHYDKARSEWISRNPKGAERELEKAVKADPQFAEAWYQLGKLQQMNNEADALGSFQKAVTADPKFVPPYEHIAELTGLQKKWQDVVNATSTALKLDPVGTPQLWYFDAVGNYNLGKTDVAEASARKSMAMDPQHLAPNTEQLLAVILANKGEYAEALAHLKNSLTYMKPGPSTELIKQQIAQLEKLVPAGTK
jgi:Tfp pilus assembly protein PilF